MPPRLSFPLASLLFACGLIARAHAAELGDARVNSFIGQHLSADIELTALDDPAGQVQVRVASLDVYRGANLDMPPVLASINLSVMKREGRQFLHVTSTRPVDADHLHLYLELTDGNRKGVRLATLWFAPDPSPPALPDRVAIPMAAPAAAVIPAPVRKSAPVRPLPQSPEPAAANPPATQAEPAPKPAKPAEPPPPLPWAAGSPARPAPLKLAKAPPAPACRKQPSEAENTCVALDSKNAELRAEIGKLEARVNSLLEHDKPREPEPPKRPPQQDVAPQQAPHPAVQESPGQTASGKVTPVQPARALRSKAARQPQKGGPAKADAAATAGMPWGWIGGAGAAVFAAIGALQFWRHRRQRRKPTTVHAPLPQEGSQVEPSLG